MELFELIGKIAVTGVEEACRNIDSVADNAEKNALKICSAFDRIGNHTIDYGMNFYQPDIREDSETETADKKVYKRFAEINDSKLLSGDSLVTNLSEKFDDFLGSLDSIEPFEMIERYENITDESYLYTNRDENIFEQSNTEKFLSQINENFSNINRDEKYSESFDVKSFLSQINEKISNVNRDENYSESFDMKSFLSQINEKISNVNRDEKYSESFNVKSFLSQIYENFSNVNRDENYSESFNMKSFLSQINKSFSKLIREEKTYENHTSQSFSSKTDENFSNTNRDEKYSESFDMKSFLSQINRSFSNLSREEKSYENHTSKSLLSQINNLSRDEKFSENLSVYKFLNDGFLSGTENPSDGILQQINNMQKAIKQGMPKVIREHSSQLERLSAQSRTRWQKIGSHSSDGIQKMADGINSKMPYVVSSAKTVADNSLQALRVDGYGSGEYLIQTFGDGISQKAHAVYNSVSQIAANISSIMSGITFSSVSIDTKSEELSIPKYATGGIVTREHIARVGEDGAEAIIPLEHNTEWIDKVASRMSGSTSNSAVVAKLDELNNNIKNLRIYLDGRTLVGGIANEMDRRLGSMAKQKGRF